MVPALLIVAVSVLILGAAGLALWYTMRKGPEQVAAPAPVEAGSGEDRPKPDANPAVDGSKKAAPPPKERFPKKEPKLPKEPAPKSPAGDWLVKPDPLPEPVELPETIQGTVAIGGNAMSLLYPTAPSPFICVSQKGPRGDVREVWDLRTMKKTATLMAGSLAGAAALSPDGRYLAGQERSAGDPVNVWSTADGRLLASVPVTEPFPRDVEVDFAGAGKLVIGLTSAEGSAYRVVD
ncbi:MAG TPA: hypothetical protein VH092_38325, partial [Urbifossiella sp.]|nr:hypothetical protein [Urbifossiella sp.]